VGTGLTLPSPRAPTIESKWLIFAVYTSHIFFLLVEFSHIRKCCKIVADKLSTFCDCGWSVAAIASGVYL
jgi:hypothetical protein